MFEMKEKLVQYKKARILYANETPSVWKQGCGENFPKKHFPSVEEIDRRKMSSLFRRPSLTRLLLMKAVRENHKSTISSKPPKDKIGPVQSVFAICLFAVTLLGPAGWILHHIPEYRQKSPPHA